jgi:hypothetical protein
MRFSCFFSMSFTDGSLMSESNQLSETRGFDELEVVQLIPVIIEQLRQGHVTDDEKLALEKIFGDLWQVILDEAKRQKNDEMNPLLRTILQSEEVKLTKRDIKQQIDNDIYKNSIRRVYRGDDSKTQRPYIAMDDERRILSPSERLLRMIAAIVHKTNAMERTAKKIKQQKKKILRKQMKMKKEKNPKNPLGIITIDPPKQKFIDKIFGMNRIKRSLVQLNTDLTDMRAFIDQINQSDEDYEEDEQNHNDNAVEEEDELDDYLNDDDDYYYDDEDDNEDDFQIDNLNSRYSNNIFDEYEGGSVREFIELAKQRDRRLIQQKSSYFNDNNDDIDDENDDDDDIEY